MPNDSPQAASDSSQATIVKEITVGRAELFDELLLDIGVDKILDEALASSKPPKRSGRSDWTQPQEPSEEAPSELVQVSAGELWLAMIRHRVRGRLARIVLEGTDEAIADAPTQLVKEGLLFFAMDSLELGGVLLGYATGSASPQAARGATPTPSAQTSS